MNSDSSRPAMPVSEREALAELVALEALLNSIQSVMFKNWVGFTHTPESNRRREEYNRRLPRAWAAARAALTHPASHQGAEPTHRHIKRGSTYTERGRGKLQTDVPINDMSELVAYQAEDGAWWFRTPSEFDDPKRFEKIK